MRILHFTESFSQPTETFIKRYVQKSCLFATVGVVAFNFQNIDEELKNKVSFFEIINKLYTRKTISGATRFISEQLSGNRLWYTELNNAIKEFKPDIIHCHFGNTGIMMMEFNRIYKKHVPYVTSFYGYDISSQPFLDQKYRSKLIKLWEDGNGFFAEGPELLKKITALGCSPSKCLVNPLLIPVEDYLAKEHYRVLGEPAKFLFIGRFIEKKGLQVFLKAIGLIKDRICKFSIDIIGAGPYKEIYERVILEYELEPVIKWHGMVKHTEIIPMMRGYDFLIHSSLTAKDNDSEGGAPTIIIEAEAVGLPIITTDHDDIPFVMGYKTFLAKENDVNSLIIVIEEMINCENIKHYAELGMQKVYNLHDLNMNTTYEDNLKKLINQN